MYEGGDYRFLLLAGLARGVDEVEHYVGVPEGLGRDIAEAKVELLFRDMVAGSIEEYELPLALIYDASDGVPRGLRNRRDDGHLLADERVDERGLAGGWTAGDGDES